MIIFAHRGASGCEPENTVPAFVVGRKYTTNIEVDIHCVEDNLVAIHDDTVNRTTNQRGRVADFTFEALRMLDAGNGAKIPTLHEVLDAVGSDAYVNIELKGEGTAALVAKVISGYARHKPGWSYSDFLVSSFRHDELAQFHRLLPDVRIGVLFCGVPVNLAQYAKDMGAYSIHLDVTFVTPALVNSAHGLGLQVYVYTVNDRHDVERMRIMGVDGIFTDYPDRIKG